MILCAQIDGQKHNDLLMNLKNDHVYRINHKIIDTARARHNFLVVMH